MVHISYIACLVHGLHGVWCLFQGRVTSAGFDWGEMGHKWCIQCLWVLSLSFAGFQICVWSVDMHCVHAQASKRVRIRDYSLHHARHSCSVFTALWCGRSVVKLTFCLHQTPSWLWLALANSLVLTHQGINCQHNAKIMGRLSSPASKRLYS